MVAETEPGLARPASVVPRHGRLGLLIRLVSIVRSSGSPWTLVWLALVLAQAIVPIVLAFAFGRLVAAVPPLARDGLDSAAGRDALLASGLAGLALLANNAAQVGARALDDLVGRRLEAALQLHVIDVVNRPTGIRHLEDPATRTAIDLAREVETSIYPPTAAVRALHQVLAAGLQGIAAAIVLLTFRWWAPIAVAAGWAFQILWEKVRPIPEADRDQAEYDLRRYEYLRALAFDPGAAKELRVFGLAAWLASRAEARWHAGVAGAWQSRRLARGLLVGIVSAMIVGHVLVFGAIVGAGVAGEITIAQVAVYLQLAFNEGVSLTQLYGLMTLRAAAPPVRHALVLEDRVAAAGDALGTKAAPRRGAADLPRAAIVLDSIGFAYPRNEHPVFDALDLSIPAGRSTAIVGENGAGKTTLVKLVAGLYAPQRGVIRVDGVDLRDLDPRSWRRQMAVLFQDYVRYPFSLIDNVTLGDADVDEAALHRVATEAGLEALARRLDRGWQTPLSPEFGGVDLSGGQWQRVGLARALYAVERGATVLVLDEPTASLDVREETRFYDRFLELTRGLTTILISHRFSSVRRADRICVIGDGRLLEAGSHDELLESGGRYARMFELQASYYRRTRPRREHVIDTDTTGHEPSLVPPVDEPAPSRETVDA